MMIRINANFLEIVMFSTYSQTLLCIGYAFAFWNGIAQKVIFELDHTRIGEEQCGIILQNQRCRGRNKVPLFFKKLQKYTPDESRIHPKRCLSVQLYVFSIYCPFVFHPLKLQGVKQATKIIADGER